MADPAFNADEARRLLASIVSDSATAPGVNIQLCAIHPNGLSIKGKEFAHRVEDAVEWAASANANGHNIYWTVNVTRAGTNKKPAKADIMGARFCHVDIDPPKTGGAFDKKGIAEGLAGIECPPSFIVDSGGGLNAYWRLDSPCENLESIEAINRQIRDYCDADHCWNIDRIMRLPGTVNWPDAKKKARGRSPVLARFVYADDGTVYEPHILAASFPPEKPTSPSSGDGTRGVVNVPANVELLTPDELGPQGGALGILDPIRIAISEPPGRDRSGDGVATARLMANAGYSDAQIMGILLNPANAVSSHYLDQRDPKRAAARTLQLVRKDRPAHDEAQEADPEIVMDEAAMAVFLANMRAKITPKALRDDSVNLPEGISHNPDAAQTPDINYTVPTGQEGWLRDLGDGPLAQFVRHVTATAARPQPYIALGAALAAFGTLAGRRYAGPTDLRTNIYAIGLCGSGGGKDHPLRSATRLLIDAGVHDHIGGSRIASGQALVTAVTRHPAIMFPIDEVGFLISAAADRRRSPKHIVDILDTMTELYSLSDSTYLGTAYANDKEKPREVIEQPCLSLIGITTPGAFWNNIKSDNVMDGSLARLILFESVNDYPDPQFDLGSKLMPVALIEVAKAVSKGAEGQNPFPLGNSAAVAPKPFTVPYSDEAAAMEARGMRMAETEMLRKHQGTPITSVIARLAENAAKLALIKAVTDNPASPAISRADLEWGMGIARRSVDSLMTAVKERVADSAYESDRKRIHNMIIAAGPNGASRTDLGQGKDTGSINPDLRKKILADLEDSEMICVVQKVPDGNGKRPAALFFDRKYWHDLAAMMDETGKLPQAFKKAKG